MKSVIAIVASVVVVVILAVAFQWRYDQVRLADTGTVGTVLVRTNRFTGAAQRFTSWGWKPLGVSGPVGAQAKLAGTGCPPTEAGSADYRKSLSILRGCE